jgi:methionyl-tRNA formyltransferase
LSTGLAYLGTSAFAATVLRRLAGSPHRPALVVTRPDRPKGRGRALQSPPVAEAARELGLPLEQPDDVHALDLTAYAHVAVCAYGALLREPLLSHPGMLNVHPSLLPRWRGAAPIERAIMAGDPETGVCIMRMVAELDAGPVCLSSTEPIRDDDDFGTLSARLEVLGADLLLRALDEDPACVPQHGTTVYAEKIGAADRVLDSGRSAAENERVVRALAPHIGAKAGDLGVWRARATDDPVAPGDVAFGDGRVLWGCAGGTLELLEVQPPGGRRMAAADYARGRA